MATVTLCEVFLNDAADPSDYMSFNRVADGYSVSTSRGGGVEGGYASGRRRGWSTAEETVTVSGLVFHMTTDAQRQWLVDHIGTTVCLRDHLGHKVFGRYQDAPLTVSTFSPDHPTADNRVSVPFVSETWDESV